MKYDLNGKERMKMNEIREMNYGTCLKTGFGFF